MMGPERQARVGFILMAPVMALFAVRQAWYFADLDAPSGLGIALGVAGSLSLLGILLVILGHRATSERNRLVVAAAIVLIGHFLVSRFVDAELGAAMVYLGTGFLVSLRFPVAAQAGMIAGAGAILRGTPDFPTEWGAVLVFAGSLATAAFLALAADGRRVPAAAPTSSG